MRRLHLAALLFFSAVMAVWLSAAAVVLSAASLPDEAGGKALAVFDPRRSADETFAAIVTSGARPIRAVLPFIWVVQRDEAGLAGDLRRNGAHLVTAQFTFGPMLAGCLAYVDPRNPTPGLQLR